MHRLQEEYLNHPIHNSIRILVEAGREKYDFINPSELAEKQRFLKVMQRSENILKSADPDFVPFEILHNIQSQIESVRLVDIAIRIKEEKNPSIYYELNHNLNYILQHILLLNNIVTKKSISRLDHKLTSETFEEFSYHIHNMQKVVDDRTAISSARIVDIETHTTTLIDQIKTISDTISTKQNELEQKFNELMTNSHEKFNNLHAMQSKDFYEISNNYRNSIEIETLSLFAAERENINKQSSKLNEILKNIQDQAEDRLEKIKKLYGLTAKDSVTGGHKSLADTELESASLWRKITVVSIATTLVWLIALFFIESPIGDREFWIKAIKSASITSLMIAFSIYASKQSSLHRLSEKKARSFFLQVQAFDPFVENLNDQNKQKLKIELTSKIFSPNDSSMDKSLLESGEFKAQVIDLISDAKKYFSK